jgi:dCTP deaminase
MILSGRDIAWYIERGKLVVNPSSPEQFQQNGMDFILEDVAGHPTVFDWGFGYLGTTKEYIEMPDDLMAFVELRSTWARHFISIPPTIIDAGFKGTITLELFVTKPWKYGLTGEPLKVPYNQRFAHIVFAKMTGPSLPYNGKYQHQRGVTDPIADGAGNKGAKIKLP